MQLFDVRNRDRYNMVTSVVKKTYGYFSNNTRFQPELNQCRKEKEGCEGLALGSFCRKDGTGSEEIENIRKTGNSEKRIFLQMDFKWKLRKERKEELFVSERY